MNLHNKYAVDNAVVKVGISLANGKCITIRREGNLVYLFDDDNKKRVCEHYYDYISLKMWLENRVPKQGLCPSCFICTYSSERER